MPKKIIHLHGVQGLSASEIPLLQQQYGKNVFHTEPPRNFIHITWDIVKEPMFILLAVACSLYFVLGELGEGLMMVVAMLAIAAISFFQDAKSTHALRALKEFIQPMVLVVRNGNEITVPIAELVPGDILILEEGMNIPADAIYLQGNDFTVNESIITGESLPVEKHEAPSGNMLYQGTTINTGTCIAKVTFTGSSTALGKLGRFVQSSSSPRTLMQVQISKFIGKFSLFGIIAFVAVFAVNYVNNHAFENSLLFALALAMSVVPEEIPVAFSSFMALGAYKMSKLGIISRHPQVVENLGAVSTICFDKTGTITENRMRVCAVYAYATGSLNNLDGKIGPDECNVLMYGMLASESRPFDAMEKAIVEACQLYSVTYSNTNMEMVYEYPLEGHPPMMTHVYGHGNTKVAASKGAAEKILGVCNLDATRKHEILGQVKLLAGNGYRVIGVASAQHEGNDFPVTQDNFNWRFEGLLALYDPPKQNVASVISQFHHARISVKLITGDYPETAVTIAGQVGIMDHFNFLTGEQVIKMDPQQLQQSVKVINVFGRMFPDAKLKVINSLKANGEIVAMTGDGVNDGPALKSADVGIAMGKKGTGIAKQAADIILTDDNAECIVTAIKEGRKMFSNFQKAILYIISIHIPIILVSSLPLVLGWRYANIFSPIHIIFMELIMGPTCSIFFEREPVEGDVMQQPPRERTKGLIKLRELYISIFQGIIIAAIALLLYRYSMDSGNSIKQTRNIVFTLLILCNLFLTFTLRSFTSTICHTIHYQNRLVPLVLIASIGFLSFLHFVPGIRTLFELGKISVTQFLYCLLAAVIATLWFELYKAFKAKD